jgi:MacB-like protein
VSFALRVLVILAAVTPLFAAEAFHPLWWQTLLAAALGSALGQVAVRFTRGRRVATVSVAIVAASIAALAAAWSLARGARHHDSTEPAFLIVTSPAGGGIASLTWDDIQAIQTRIPTIRFAVPYLHKTMQLASDDQNWSSVVAGTTPDYFDLRGWQLAAGQRFAADEQAKVVVVGATVVTQLFGAGKQPVGEVIRIGNMPFTIAGVLAHQGMSPQGQDLDDIAIVPIAVYQARLAFAVKSRFDGVVLVSATTPGDMTRVQAELRELLRDRHRLAAGAQDDFVIRSSKPD